MQSRYDEFEKRGARVLALGQGTGDEAAEVCRGVGTGFDCLGDPDKRAYAAFQLPRGGWWSVVAKPFVAEPGVSFDRLRRASLKGSLMAHTDVLQLPGVAIVDAAGVVRHLHRAQKTDDLPDAAEILAQLDRIAAA